MNKKKILLLVLVLTAVVIGILVVVYKNNVNFSATPATKEYAVATPEGWQRYVNSEWGFTFSYPANWSLQERRSTPDINKSSNSVGKFNGVTIDGDGYRFTFDSFAGDLPEEYTYTRPEYTIAGTKITGIKYETDSKFGLFLNIPLGNSRLSIRVGNTVPNARYTPIIDQILSTVEVIR